MKRPRERSWNDYKEKRQIKKGPWTDREVYKLKKLLCKYAYKHQMTTEDLARLCSDTTPTEFKNVWTQLATFFPERSVQSIHNVCKRAFNPNNYRGAWTLAEEQQLIRYVEQHGNKWKEIGDLLNRTALNVKDKWKQMGGSNHKNRRFGTWGIDEMIELFKFIQETLKIRLLPKQSETIKTEEQLMQRTQASVQKYMELLKNLEINWNALAERLLTRTAVDCRLKWSNVLYFKMTGGNHFTEEEDIQLIQDIKTQKPSTENEIDFKSIQNSKTSQQNRSRWRLLSKNVSGRLRLTLPEIFEKLDRLYFKQDPSEAPQESILDYYTKKYLLT
jgi:hypothetical protein